MGNSSGFTNEQSSQGGAFSGETKPPTRAISRGWGARLQMASALALQSVIDSEVLVAEATTKLILTKSHRVR